MPLEFGIVVQIKGPSIVESCDLPQYQEDHLVVHTLFLLIISH